MHLAVPSHRSHPELAQTSGSWHSPSQAEEKTKGESHHVAEVVLTVVIDGVGDEGRQGYAVVAVLVGKEGLEAEPHHVQVVLVDVVQLLLGHCRTHSTQGQAQNQHQSLTKLGVSPHQDKRWSCPAGQGCMS